MSRGVLAAEGEQGRCQGNETAIGPIAYATGTDAVRALFGNSRKRAGLDYDTVLNELSEKNDSTAKAARTMGAAGLLKPATAPTTPLAFPIARQDLPSRPDLRDLVHRKLRTKPVRAGDAGSIGRPRRLACSFGLAYR